MIPLSCENCLHNPLQLGPIGTAFGYCTFHRKLLHAPAHTTCGRQLRKDLLSLSANREQALHAKVYAKGHISLVAEPKTSAEGTALVEPPNGHLPADPVLEEVVDYGQLDTKVASLAALRRVSGTRAEVARNCLSRAYFSNCFKTDKRWTAGIHLLWWTLEDVAREPVLEATDLRQVTGGLTLERFVDLAKWYVLALRLALMADIGNAAGKNESVWLLTELAEKAASSTKAGSGTSVLHWVRRRKSALDAAFPRAKYYSLKEELHRAR